MLNILDKNFFKSDLGKELAKKYFGYEYDNDYNNKKIEKNNILSTKNSLDLYDIAKYYKNQGVVGEENLVCAITLAAISKASFGVEGFSGSGKTFIVDKLIKLLPDVYKIQQSSNLAVFNDSERINESKFIYIPELQKAMKNKNSAIIEVIKNITEGKDANRIVTKKNGDGIIEYSIKKGVTIIYTLAIENDFKKDDESSRRLIRFRTDSSKSHLDNIHEQKAKQRYSLENGKKSADNLENKIRGHIYECNNLKDINTIDPFSDYISNFIPKTQKSVGYVDHYYSLLDACAKFHFNQRKRFEMNNSVYMLINLEDHYNIYEIYFKEFLDTLKDLAKKDENIDISIKPDWKECFEKGYNILSKSKELEELRFYCPKLIEQWRSSQVENYKIKTINFRTGENIVIADFEEKINALALYKNAQANT